MEKNRESWNAAVQVVIKSQPGLSDLTTNINSWGNWLRSIFQSITVIELLVFSLFLLFCNSIQISSSKIHVQNKLLFLSKFFLETWLWKLNHPPQRDITEILSPILSLKWGSDTPYHFPHLWDKTTEHDPPQLHGKETWGKPSSDPRDVQCNPPIKKIYSRKNEPHLNDNFSAMFFAKDLEQKGKMWRNGTRQYKMKGLTHVTSSWKKKEKKTVIKRLTSYDCLIHRNLITLELSWMTGIWSGITFYQSWETLHMVTRGMN